MRLPVRLSFLWWFVIFTTWACSGSEPEQEAAANRLEHDFFPLETGRFVEYEVTETQYALAAPPLIRTSWLREVVREPFTDATGQPAFRLERFRRATDDAPWQLDSVWAARLETNRVVKTEGNVARVKLVFPLREDLRWNGNALNDRGPQEYRVRRFDTPRRMGAFSFPRTLEVVQREDSSLVSLERRTERYARGVGLIESEDTRLFYCTSAACLGKGRVDFGRQTMHRIRTHGKE